MKRGGGGGGAARARLALLALACAAGACAGSKGAQKSKAGATVVLPATKPEARVHFEEGLRLMEDPSKAEAAIEAFTRASNADKHLFEAFHDLGIVQVRLGRWDDAAESLARALEIQPGSRRTVTALAEVYLRGHHPGDAAQLLEQQLGSEGRADTDRVDADPGDAAATSSDAGVQEMRLLYVQALREAGKLTRALEQVEKLLASSGRSARGFNALGLVYYKMDKPALAETALRHAVELDGKSAEVWSNLGLVALARGRDREAFEDFDKAVALDEAFIEARLNKAGVLLDCGDYTRALAELEKAARARPNDPDVLVALGVARRGAGKPDEARRAYEGALAIAPEFPAAHFNLGILYMDFLSDKAKAREHLQVYRKVAPSGDRGQKEAELRLKELRP